MMVTLRKMEEADVPFICEIECRVSFDPWSEKLFCDCIKVGYSCWVFAADDEIAGYGLLSSAAGEAHILNVAIKPEWQRQGLGRRMMLHLIEIARELGADILYLEVMGSNAGAIELYSELSFVEIGVRKEYYPTTEGREDAIVLALNLT